MNAAQCIHTTASQDSNATHTFSSLPCCLISRIKITSSSSRQQQLALVHTAVQGMQHTAVHTAVPTAVHAAYGSPYTVVLAAVHTAVHIRQCTQQLTAIHIVSANCSPEAPEMGSRWGHLCRFGCDIAVQWGLDQQLGWYLQWSAHPPDEHRSNQSSEASEGVRANQRTAVGRITKWSRAGSTVLEEHGQRAEWKAIERNQQQRERLSRATIKNYYQEERLWEEVIREWAW